MSSHQVGRKMRGDPRFADVLERCLSSQIPGFIFHGDNTQLLQSIPENSVHLAVTDPPFFLRSDRRNEEHPDRYLEFLLPRLELIHACLRPDGSAVIHLDQRIVHEVKIGMDRIFGRNRFINEIIWHYTGGGRSKRYFSRKHDTLLWYTKGSRWTFNVDAVRVPYKASSGYAKSGIVARSGKRYTPHPAGTPLDDVWHIPMINPLSHERCGYRYQKPLRLLQPIIAALSNPGDLVLDPFCGSGTTLVAAAAAGRRWIGADTDPVAVATTRARLKEVISEPVVVGPGQAKQGRT